MNPEFSPRGYANLIRLALEQGYRIVPGVEALQTPGPTMFLRHDVDFSLDCAIRMAEIETNLGAKSTYYVMIANDYYNIMNKSGREKIRILSSLGHEVGLHWDSSTYPEAPALAGEQFKAEVQILSQIVGAPVRTASQHIPTDSPLIDVEEFIELEAYSKVVRSRFAYVADSSMKWRERTPLHYIAEKRDIQFNAHPLWWFAEGENADEKLRTVVKHQNYERRQTLETFIDYMNQVLADRSSYDASFKAKRGWS